MGLKDLAEKSYDVDHQSSMVNIDDELQELKKSVAIESAIEGSFYFISGCVYTFMKMRGYDQIDPDDLFKRLREMKGIDRDELKNSDDPLKKFLLFYYYDEIGDKEIQEKQRSSE